MSIIAGDRTVEIDAPIEHCYQLVADVERLPEWNSSITRVQVLERDAEGRALLVESEADVKVKTARAVMRYSYDEPRKVSWVQEKGDAKSFTGSWTFTDLGSGRTRATYELSSDPGRVLGLLLRGPVETKVKEFMIDTGATGLKAAAER